MSGQVHQKVTSEHLARKAYIYIRQSTIRQLLHHQESTKRQYDLRLRAVGLGWPEESIEIIDDDLGQSAAYLGRNGFEHLVSEVGLGRAGMVISLEVSRLARNSSDWHRLLEICALCGTLICDEEGVYDLTQFNDRLLLGLKGTMSEAELHMIHSRLIGGLENKARRAELKTRIPAGFVYDAHDKVALDPDTQVQQSIKTFFSLFRQSGSAYRAAHEFNAAGLLFPTRLHDGPRKGDLVWKPLSIGRSIWILNNPRYAGAFVFGRKTQKRTGMRSGRPAIKTLPRSQWFSLVKDSHPGYIGWNDYEENLKRLAANRRYDGQSGPGAVREGVALLQGIVLCGICGRRMNVRYYHRHGRITPDYYCSNPIDARHCQSVPGHGVDDAVGKLLVEAMNPVALEIALSVEKELHKRIDEADALRRKQIERLHYESEQARRRYMQVDPDNRLVSATLEGEWNEYLRLYQDTLENYERQKKEDLQSYSAQREGEIRKLSTDFALVWNDPRTPQRERKRMVRLLIEDVALRKDVRTITMHIRFKGGRTQTLQLPAPYIHFEQFRVDRAVVDEIDRMLDDWTHGKIADMLNQKGYVSGTGKPFTMVRVRNIRRGYRLKSRLQRLKEMGLLTAKELHRKYGACAQTIRKWRKESKIKAVLCDDQGFYLYEDPGKYLI